MSAGWWKGPVAGVNFLGSFAEATPFLDLSRHFSHWFDWFIALLRVTRQRFGPPALVHFDAHLDTWQTYFGAPVTHGTPFRRAAEEGLFDERRSMHVGIRGPVYAQRDLEEDAELGFRIVSAMDVERIGIDGVEVSPAYDHAEMTSVAAAHVCFELLP